MKHLIRYLFFLLFTTLLIKSRDARRPRGWTSWVGAGRTRPRVGRCTDGVLKAARRILIPVKEVDSGRSASGCTCTTWPNSAAASFVGGGWIGDIVLCTVRLRSSLIVMWSIFVPVAVCWKTEGRVLRFMCVPGFFFCLGQVGCTRPG